MPTPKLPLKRWIVASVASIVLCSTTYAAVNVVTSGSPSSATAPSTAPSAPPAATPTADTTPPMISGVMPGIAVAGQTFSFQPSASDTDGGALTFSISSPPNWASFDPATGRLSGTPQESDVGAQSAVAISVSDGTYDRALPTSTITVVAPGGLMPRKNNYGHYFSTHYSDTPADAAKLCEQPGVGGVVWRQTWQQVEPSAGVYDFSSFDQVLGAIAGSHNPGCQLFLLVEFKSFANSPVKNPCPVYLQAQYSGLNATGGGASTCFMWEPAVVSAYTSMMKAAAVHFDSNPRVEGLILQESSLSFNGQYSQDEADGGTYTALAWRDALIEIIDQCAASFANSRCVPFLNFLKGGQSYLYDISAAISALPGNQVCFSGPDVLPDSPALYSDNNRAYQVLTRHVGCRSNSVQNDSFQVGGCGLACIFRFAVGGTFGGFPKAAPLSGGLCVNSYLFWNDRTTKSATGLDWTDALPVIAANPYGPGWYNQCAGNSGAP
jgi:hypothetical protein